MVGLASNPRARQVLSAVNMAPGDPSTAPDVASSDDSGFEIASREDVERLLADVERLLAEKMKGKNKMDFKGKSEKMSEYIKELRICIKLLMESIKWFMEREGGNLMQLEKLQGALESEEKRHAETVAQMNRNAEESDMTIKDLQGRIVSLEKSYRKKKAEKAAAMKSHEEEKLARAAAQSSRDALSEDLLKAGLEVSNLNEDIEKLEKRNKQLEEYTTSLLQYSRNLQDDAVENGKTIAKLQQEKNAMVGSLNTLRETQRLLTSKLDASKTSLQEDTNMKEELKKEVSSLRTELQQVRDDRDHQLAQVQRLSDDIAKDKEVTGESAKYLDEVMTKTKVLEATCSSQNETIQTLQQQLAVANENSKRVALTVTEITTKYEEQKKKAEYLETCLNDAKIKLAEGEQLRKKLLNTILEMKGNIRVFCRVRPTLSDGDSNSLEGQVVSFPKLTELQGRGIDLIHNAQKYSFSFDKVFGQGASQAEVFDEISQLVQSAFDGYKVCIFAYGQTGSGKTYTMMGKTEAPEQMGLIPRSLKQIFENSQSLQGQGWKYKMQASILEIYNETIRDLLSPNCPAGDAKQYAIKHDANGNIYVSDLTVVDVSSFNEASFLHQQAAQSRSVGKTQMNEHSSRSHFVFTLRIFGVNEITEQQVQGVLNLIDLAGSERLNKSGSTGDCRKETQAINKSLSTLSDVILAIAKKDDHVPFRNSKLTYLLQPYLGGDSKTLMFVNISPEPSSTGESVCSLRFAARVNSCEIRIPRHQTQMRSLDSRLSCG